MVKKVFFRWNSLFFSFFIFLLLLFVVAAYAQGSKKPLVAIEPIKCDSSSPAYIGKALSQMLITRLSSEDIDTVLVGKGKTSVVELADFILSGKVSRMGNGFGASFWLKSSQNGKTVKTWDLVASDLGMLAQKTSLLSAKMADAIKHTGEVLVADTVSNFATLAGPGSKKIEANDEFAMARLHPDILVRQRLEKDEEREIRQQKRQAQQTGSSRPLATGEDDSYMPLPDVYDAGDDVPEGEMTGNTVNKAATVKTEEEDDNSFFPLPDVYEPDDDENAVETPKKVSVKNETQMTSAGDTEEGSSPSSGAAQKEKGSWYSWLWPFGSKEKENQLPTVSQAKETRLEKEKEDKEPVVVSSKEKLPVPPPPEVEFSIPEPVPLEKALGQIENIKVERKKEKGWLSRLWPWGDSDEELVVKTTPPHVMAQEVQKPVEGGVHSFDSGAQIEALRRQLEMERGHHAEGGSQLPAASVPAQALPSSPKEVTEKKIEVPSVEAPENGPAQTQGPIWQWN